jgi:hypothetical protein
MSLYKHKLLEVYSPELVKRYKEAMETLALEPTGLSQFHIDGRGWSPEIALEQNPNYLSHGPANLLAIILSPEQRGLPVVSPLTSFDRRVLQQYFDKYAKEIADMSQSTALCLELDHTPPRYADIAEVAAFESVTVKTSAGSFGDAANEQQALITKFLDDEVAWSDPGLRQQIIESAKRHGDMRGRTNVPAEFVVSDIPSFYMNLFNGVYVIQLDRRRKFMVLEDKGALRIRSRHVYYLQDPKLLPKLLDEEVLALEESYYRKNLDSLKVKHEAMLSDVLFQLEPDLELSKLTALQRKKLLTLNARVFPKVLFELENVIAKLSSDVPLSSGDLSSELIVLLLYPNPKLDQITQDVIWQLLTRVQTLRLQLLDVGQLYQWDQAYFFELFQGWSTPRQLWAEKLLKAQGIIPRKV